MSDPNRSTATPETVPPSRLARWSWKPKADAVDRHAAGCDRCRRLLSCSELRRLEAIERAAWAAYQATWESVGVRP